MTERELKIKFDHIQGIFNRCINHASQVMIDGKSSEITAIPLLINSLELSGCIVTIDAMGCQKDITQTIIGHDANYIIAIKENKKKNYQPAKQIIDDYQDRDEIINRVIRHVSEKCRTWKD